jgi:tRNA (guanine37-N1)-methyltransferase
MKFDIVTIFPRMFERPAGECVVARGVDAGLIDLHVHDLRDFTTDRHRVVDDVPYGGGPGMVMKPEPFFRAVAQIRATRGEPDAVLLTSPQGRPLTDRRARELAGLGHVVILCGRYEGVDDRVRAHVATEEISIGDYVLSGGELAAMVIVDVVSRLVPGVVGDERSVASDSFARGLLDYPHYTRPAEFEGRRVPEVLLSGHHGEIARWRARESVRRTRAARPDLLADAELDALEQAAYEEAVREGAGGAEFPAAQDEGAKS